MLSFFVVQSITWKGSSLNVCPVGRWTLVSRSVGQVSHSQKVPSFRRPRSDEAKFYVLRISLMPSTASETQLIILVCGNDKRTTQHSGRASNHWIQHVSLNVRHLIHLVKVIREWQWRSPVTLPVPLQLRPNGTIQMLLLLLLLLLLLKGQNQNRHHLVRTFNISTYFCTNCLCDIWNSLPVTVVEAPSITVLIFLNFVYDLINCCCCS